MTLDHLHNARHGNLRAESAGQTLSIELACATLFTHCEAAGTPAVRSGERATGVTAGRLCVRSTCEGAVVALPAAPDPKARSEEAVPPTGVAPPHPLLFLDNLALVR